MIEVCLQHNYIRGHADWHKSKRPVARIIFRLKKPTTEGMCPDCRAIKRITDILNSG